VIPAIVLAFVVAVVLVSIAGTIATIWPHVDEPPERVSYRTLGRLNNRIDAEVEQYPAREVW